MTTVLRPAERPAIENNGKLRDRLIARKVARAMSQAECFAADQICVSVVDGVVSLTGEGCTSTQRKTAHQVAQTVPGVNTVQCHFQID